MLARARQIQGRRDRLLDEGAHLLAEPLQLLAGEIDSLVQVTDASGITLYLGGAE